MAAAKRIINIYTVRPADRRPAQDVSFEEKMKLVLETDKHLRDEENIIKTTRTRYTDILRRQTLATSEGTLIYEERPYTNFTMNPTARKGTETNQGRSPQIPKEGRGSAERYRGYHQVQGIGGTYGRGDY